MGNGDGTFQAPQYLPTGADPTSVVVGDFHGDRQLDIATANAPDNTVSILLGNGDGTFQNARDFPAGTDATGPLVTGHFRRGGSLDLAVLSDTGVNTLLGNGDDTLSAIAPCNIRVILACASPAVARAGCPAAITDCRRALCRIPVPSRCR